MGIMQISKPLVVVSAALLAVATVGSVCAYRVAKWAVRALQPTREAAVAVAAEFGPSSFPQSVAPGDASSAMDDSWRPGQVGSEMSDAFNTGKLPQPLNVIAADPDSAAVELAQKVSLRDQNSTPAFLAALKSAGFNVRDSDGRVVIGASNTGQGIVFDDWEIASAAKFYGDGFHISLQDFSDAFTQSVPGFKAVPFARLIMAGIRADADSKKPELRFWSRFIVELGKRADPSYDLLSPALDPRKVQLDGLQFAFITRRLVADFAILGAKGSKSAKTKPLQRSQNSSCQPRLQNADFRLGSPTPHLIDSVWRPAKRFEYTPAAFQESSGGNSKLPCNLSEGQMQILDTVAYGFGIGFDQLMEILGEPGILTEGATSAVEAYGKFSLISNILLTYGKLVFAFLTLHAGIEMDSPPLVRTLDPVPGCRRKLRAQIVQKVGNWQIINCLRTALNVAGLDVSLPADGPLKGVPTMWHIVQGGVNVAEAAATGRNTAIVEFVCNGPRIQDAGTYAGIEGAVPGGIAVGDCVQPKTDEEGRTEVDVEGTGRRTSLQGWAAPVKKTAKVQLSFAPKPISMRQDLIDTLAAGGLLSNPITLLTTVPVEMILRSRWLASPVFTVPVKDWEACGGGWIGTITYTETEHEQTGGGGADANGNTHSRTFDYSQTVEVHLAGNSEPNPEGLSHGNVSLSLHQETVDQGSTLWSWDPGTMSGRSTKCAGWEKDTDTTQASGGGPMDVAVSLVGNTYYVGIIGDVPSVTGESKQAKTGHWPCSALLPPRPPSSFTVDARFPSFAAVPDPNSPSELIGSTSSTDPVTKRASKTTWNLHSGSRVTNVCRQ